MIRRLCYAAGLACLAALSLAQPAPVSAQLGAGDNVRCVVEVSTATALTAVGGKCAAPGPGLVLQISDVLFSASATGIAADAFPTLKQGTGGTCGTDASIVWGALSAAAVIVIQPLKTPIRLKPNYELCWISSTAGSKFLVITGQIVPQ